MSADASALALTHAMLDAWNAEDPEAIYRHWHPDIVVYPDPGFPEGVLLGQEARRRFWEIVEFFVDDERGRRAAGVTD